MYLQPAQYLLGVCSGGLVGASLGLFGGGGSILAVPLMVYVVGVADSHVAIGTSALAVSANACANLVTHARRGNVNWRCAAIYSVAGVAGAFAGSTLGKALDGKHLLLLFALLMMAVATLMFRRRHDGGNPDAACTIENAPKTVGFGATTGALSGFFGIGGGFLIVPGLVSATGMPLLNAIGSSLVAVAAFGLTTALNYARSGLIDWPLAADFLLGGIAGGVAGALGARSLGKRKGMLGVLFSGVIFAVGLYVAWQGLR